MGGLLTGGGEGFCPQCVYAATCFVCLSISHSPSLSLSRSLDLSEGQRLKRKYARRAGGVRIGTFSISRRTNAPFVPLDLFKKKESRQSPAQSRRTRCSRGRAPRRVIKSLLVQTRLLSKAWPCRLVERKHSERPYGPTLVSCCNLPQVVSGPNLGGPLGFTCRTDAERVVRRKRVKTHGTAESRGRESELQGR